MALANMAQQVQPVDWVAIGPPLVLVLTAIGTLFLPARLGRSGASIGLILAFVALVFLAWDIGATESFDSARRAVFCTPDGCSYQVNSLTLVLQAIVLLGTATVVLLSRRRAGEFHFLLLASAAGAASIAGARDLVTIVVALELVTLPAIAVVGLPSAIGTAAGTATRSAESTVKFFLFSVVSSAVMLFGVGLLYGTTGTLQLEAVGDRLGQAHPGLVATAGLLTLVGFAFKLGAVPFHFWVPDTYVGAPIPVAAYLSVVSKSAGLVALISVVGWGFGGETRAGWAVTGTVAVVAVLTMTVGNVVALRQSDAVRLLAWSSIAQAGFVLLPLGALASARPDVLGASVAYLVIYAVYNLGAFAVVSVVGTRVGGGTELASFRGLFHRQRWLALALAFFLLGLAGLPPGLAGLFGKVVVIQAAVRGEVTWLAVVAAINVAIGLAYYLRWTAALFAGQDTEPDTVPVTGSVNGGARIDRTAAITVGLLAVVGIVLSLAPGFALRLVTLTP